ncbi:Glycosyl hydrolase [Trema orientale]|uniref:Glycosyl hydrolase n=1 Tax=Trema orientale TaxID=63057 RepID=A0A2P5EI94_TREOI|nr:Glycosyl hydrolase [Trema orientale]
MNENADWYTHGMPYLATGEVDVHNIFEILSSGYGGRVALTKEFLGALEESVTRNFKSNNLICSMSQNTECIYSSKQIATATISEDFMPNEPTFQTLHIASVAFYSLLMGEIIIPDWEMSTHYTAEFHGAARAIGGCAIYVSDKPGHHNFDIIKKLVLPDGSILPAKYAGRRTRDCIFIDPVTDEKSLLKIWNLNKLTVVVGSVSPLDVDLPEEAADESWRADCALYSFSSGSLIAMPKERSFEVSLGILKFDVFTVAPIRVFDQNLQFAPIGLLDMYNSGGAVQSLQYKSDPTCVVKVQVRGSGRIGAYSNRKPKYCSVDMKGKLFVYNAKEGLLTFNLGEECSLKDVEIVS